MNGKRQKHKKGELIFDKYQQKRSDNNKKKTNENTGNQNKLVPETITFQPQISTMERNVTTEITITAASASDILFSMRRENMCRLHIVGNCIAWPSVSSCTDDRTNETQ